MITRIRLTDFMAHADTDLALGPGLTVLTGPNNTGKSAVVEALRCLATNTSSNLYVRHGAQEARVEVEMEEGVRVLWARTVKGSRSYSHYEVHRPGAEPEEYWKLRQGEVPEAVAALLKLGPVALDGNKGEVDVHLGNQREPVFLLDKPGSHAAAFFAASSESAHLLRMQRLLETKRREAQREDRDLAARMERLAAGLDDMAPLPDLELALEACAAQAEAWTRFRDAEPRLARTATAIAAQLRRRVALTARQARLASLQAPPQTAPTLPLAVWLDEHRRSTARRHGLDRKAVTLRPLRSAPVLEPTAPAARLLQELDASLKRRAALVNRSLALQNLAAPPEHQDNGPLAQLAAALRGRAVQRMALAGRAKTLVALPAPPVLEDTATLDSLRAGLADLEAKRKGQRTLSADLLRSMDALRRRLAALVKDSRCPVCGGPLDADAVLGGGHRHA